MQKKIFGNLTAYQLLRAVKLSEKNFDFRNCLMVYGSSFVPNLSSFTQVYQTIPVGWLVDGWPAGWRRKDNSAKLKLGFTELGNNGRHKV